MLTSSLNPSDEEMAKKKFPMRSMPIKINRLQKKY